MKDNLKKKKKYNPTLDYLQENVQLLRFTFLLAFFLLLIPNLTSAVEIRFEKNSSDFSQGETLLAIVSGNFLDAITNENVFFYKDHVQIPIEYEIGKMNNEFYLYSSLVGKEPGNYSIKIKNVRYMNGTMETKADIVKNFTIKDNMASFSVKPGFVRTRNDFYLEVQNLLSSGINLNISPPNTLSSITSIYLQSGETKRIYFSLKTENKFFGNIRLSSQNTEYFIPVLLDNPEQIIEVNDGTELEFEPKTINVSLATNSSTKRIIYLRNRGGRGIENIYILVPSSLEPYINISPKNLSILKNDSAKAIQIFINSSSQEMVLSDEIKAIADNASTSATVILHFIKDYTPVNGTDEREILPTCSEINGVICDQDQECTSEPVNSEDGLCCLFPATCEEKPKSSLTGKIIGWSIVLLAIILLFWFFKKYKRARPKVDLLKVAQGDK